MTAGAIGAGSGSTLVYGAVTVNSRETHCTCTYVTTGTVGTHCTIHTGRRRTLVSVTQAESAKIASGTVAGKRGNAASTGRAIGTGC